jgi:hypothetical protein
MPDNCGHPWAGEIVENVDDEDAQSQSAAKTRQAAPRPVLSVVDAVALIVGVVVGAGIFKTRPWSPRMRVVLSCLYSPGSSGCHFINWRALLCRVSHRLPQHRRRLSLFETRVRPRHGFPYLLRPV